MVLKNSIGNLKYQILKCYIKTKDYYYYYQTLGLEHARQTLHHWLRAPDHQSRLTEFRMKAPGVFYSQFSLGKIEHVALMYIREYICATNYSHEENCTFKLWTPLTMDIFYVKWVTKLPVNKHIVYNVTCPRLSHELQLLSLFTLATRPTSDAAAMTIPPLPVCVRLAQHLSFMFILKMRNYARKINLLEVIKLMSWE